MIGSTLAFEYGGCEAGQLLDLDDAFSGQKMEMRGGRAAIKPKRARGIPNKLAFTNNTSHTREEADILRSSTRDVKVQMIVHVTRSARMQKLRPPVTHSGNQTAVHYVISTGVQVDPTTDISWDMEMAGLFPELADPSLSTATKDAESTQKALIVEKHTFTTVVATVFDIHSSKAIATRTAMARKDDCA